MEVIVMKVVRKISSALVAGVIGAGISPFAGDGLDEALGLAVGLRAVGFGEGVFEAQLSTGLGKESGAVGGAAIGEDPLNADAVILVEGDGLMEGSEHAGGLFVGKKTGESEAGVIIDGDVQALDAGARIAVGAISCRPDAGTFKAAQLLDVEVEEFAGSGAFVADDGRFGRLQRGEPIEAVAAEDAGEGGLGNGQTIRI